MKAHHGVSSFEKPKAAAPKAKTAGEYLAERAKQKETMCMPDATRPISDISNLSKSLERDVKGNSGGTGTGMGGDPDKMNDGRHRA